MKTTTVRPRRLAAAKSLESTMAALDAQSIVALEWAALTYARHFHVHATPAVVIRRALQLLALHLTHIEAEDLPGEGQHLERTALGQGSARSLTEARARIETHRGTPGLQPMDSWLDALHSPEERATVEAVNAAFDARFPKDPKRAVHRAPAVKGAFA